MIARHKWQINTIAALELVFEERLAQMEKHGAAMRDLPDGTGPDTEWCAPLPLRSRFEAWRIQRAFREDYEQHRGAENPDGPYGQLTRMHLVREELAEVFELDGDDPNFISEAIQVAALLVQWVEYKLEEQGKVLCRECDKRVEVHREGWFVDHERDHEMCPGSGTHASAL